MVGAFRQSEAEGLLTDEPSEGAMLTEAGRRRGAELHETYVTLPWFFRGVLDLEVAAVVLDPGDVVTGVVPRSSFEAFRARPPPLSPVTLTNTSCLS